MSHSPGASPPRGTQTDSMASIVLSDITKKVAVSAVARPGAQGPPWVAVASSGLRMSWLRGSLNEALGGLLYALVQLATALRSTARWSVARAPARGDAVRTPSDPLRTWLQGG